MGNTHVARGDQVKYPVCPPASGKHVNNPPYGPIPPKVYAPDSGVVPNGWVHNLEHGGLVLLYSCDKGACDDASLQQLQAFYDGFPSSPVCGLAPGTIGPVIAPFEQMPTKYAALVWDRVLYLDELDVDQIYDFFTRYAERVDSDGNWLAPPEPQCNPPSPSPSAGESPSAGASPAAAASPSARGEPLGSGEPGRRAPVEPVAELTIGRCGSTPTRTAQATPTFGVLVGDRLLTGGQLEKRGRVLRHLDPHDGLGSAIRIIDTWRGALDQATRRALTHGAPLVNPEKRRPVAVIDRFGLGGKVVCVGLNYGDHAREGGRAAPDRPMLFAKFANALIGDGDAIVRPPGTHALDLEVELGVVIGRAARRVDARRPWTTSRATSSSTTSARATGRATSRPCARARRATDSGCARRAATRSCRSARSSSRPTSWTPRAG